MAQKLKKLIPFSNRMVPDVSRFGYDTQFAKGVIPTYNGFRGVSRPTIVNSNLFGALPITGSAQHIFLQDSSVQKSVVESDFDETKLGFRRWNSNSDSNLYDLIDEQFPDFGDYFLAGGAYDGASVKFNVSDYSIPSGTANWKFRAWYLVEGNSGGTANINWTLYEDDGTTVLDGPTNIHNSSSNTNGWQFFEDTFTGNLSWPLNPVIGIESTTFGSNQTVVPTSEVNNDLWRNELGNTVDIGASIDEGSSVDDDDFVVSKPVGISGSTQYKIKFQAEDPLARADASVENAINIRWKKPQAGSSLNVKLLQGEAEIASWNVGTSAAQATFVTTQLDLTATEFNSITDFSNLYLLFTFSGGEAGSYVYDEIDPVSVDNGGEGFPKWYNQDDDDVDINLDVDEGSDSGDTTTFIRPTLTESFVLNPVSAATFNLGQTGQRGHMTGSTFHVRAKSTTGSSSGLDIKLYRDSTLILDDSVTVTTSITDIPVDVSAAQLQNAANANETIYFSLIDQATSDGYREVYSTWLEVPVQNSLYISSAWLSLPPRSLAAIAWIELETPATTDSAVDDQGTIYCGDMENLYVVNDNFTSENVSRAAGYGQGDRPRSWRFAQWGNDMVATNHVDEVQIRTANAGDFDDLIVSTKKPRGKDVITVLDFLMLLNTAGEAEASPDGVWWSALNDISDFDPSITTQSDYQYLRDTPGQITCGVGGEYAIIFKARSIYRMEYVGSPLIFNKFLLSSSVGTEYPFSVVPVGRDIYFFDGRVFRVLKNGQELIDLPGDVNKFFNDLEFEPYSMLKKGNSILPYEESSIRGAYNYITNQIWWAYSTRDYWVDILVGGSGEYGFYRVPSHFLIYDIDSQRFSLLGQTFADAGWANESSLEKLPNNGVCTDLLGLKKYNPEGINITRGMVSFGMQNGPQITKWDHEKSYGVDIRTGVFSIEDSSVNIHSVRPVFTFERPPAVESSSRFVIDLDGNDGLADGGNILNLSDENSEITFRARFKTSSSDVQAILSKGSGSGGYLLAVNGGNVIWNLSDSVPNTVEASVLGEYDNGEWHEVWAVLDRTNDEIRIRVGQGSTLNESSSSVSGVGSPSNALSFLVGGFDGSLPFNGQLDEIAVWDRALTNSEIEEFYGVSIPQSAGTIAYYKMNENGGTVLIDESLEQLNLDLTGGFEWATGGLSNLVIDPPVVEDITITVESADNPEMIDSEVVSSVEHNSNGWFHLRNTGQYHKVTFQLAGSVKRLREAIGVEVEYNIEGLR